MKSDAQLQKDILAELQWDPIVNETDVGVIVRNGVVTLIHDELLRQADREARKIEVSVAGSQVTLEGRVHSWAERMAAQGAAGRRWPCTRWR